MWIQPDCLDCMRKGAANNYIVFQGSRSMRMLLCEHQLYICRELEHAGKRHPHYPLKLTNKWRVWFNFAWKIVSGWAEDSGTLMTMALFSDTGGSSGLTMWCAKGRRQHRVLSLQDLVVTVAHLQCHWNSLFLRSWSNSHRIATARQRTLWDRGL